MMNNFIYEAVLKKTFDTSGDVWNSLIEAGLANDDGSLNDAAISILGGIEPTTDKAAVEEHGGSNEGEVVGAVIGTDTRTRVVHTDTAPYKSIVLLLMKFGDKMYRGTGFMIKDNVVLTAAHNIYDQQEEKPADEIYVIGEPKDKAHVRSCNRFRVSVNYVAKVSDDGHYDWGLIKLNEPMDDLGVINIKKASEAESTALGNVLIAGYPGTVQGAKTTDMWEAGGATSGYVSAKEILNYKISTSKGNSGSPVMISDGTAKTAIGIHVMGGVAENTAKAIDDEVISSINAFN